MNFKRSAKQFDYETYNCNLSLFEFFLITLFKKLLWTFSVKHYNLVKAFIQYNKLLVSTQNEISLHYCWLLQSFELKPTKYVNVCDQTI